MLSTALESVVILEPQAHGDARGFFMESYNRRELAEAGLEATFVQDNHSLSKPAGVLRGLHYQDPPFAQTKLVRVIHGAVYDVAVDIRNGSPTFGQWISAILTADNQRQLWIPKGFAHGFCTLVADTEVLYKVDAYYSAAHDRGIRWNDPDLGIPWPVSQPILSEKDHHHPTLAQATVPFVFEEE